MKNTTTLLVIASLFCNFLYAQIIPPQNVILHLTFDGNSLADQSIFNHQVIDHNTTVTPAINQEGLNLAGDDNYLEIVHSGTLQIPNEVSISYWYQHQMQATSSFYSLVEQSADVFGGHSRYGNWVFNQNTLMTCVEPDICPNGGTLCQRCVRSEARLEVGEWYHIVSTYDGGSQKIYINGQLDKQEDYDISTGISTLPYPMTIGTDIYDGNPVYLRGTMDEIRVMDIALTQAQVTALYEEFTLSSIHNEAENPKVQIFPNPACNYIDIKADFEITEVNLYDLKGNIVDHLLHLTANRLNISNLPRGVYLITLHGTEKVASRKVVVDR